MHLGPSELTGFAKQCVLFVAGVILVGNFLTTNITKNTNQEMIRASLL